MLIKQQQKIDKCVKEMMYCVMVGWPKIKFQDELAGYETETTILPTFFLLSPY